VTPAEVAAKIGQGREKFARGTWTVPCPAHDDHDPSLDISEGTDGRVLMICRAGCSQEAVLIAAAPRLDRPVPATKSRKRTSRTLRGRITDVYGYTDEQGRCSIKSSACFRRHFANADQTVTADSFGTCRHRARPVSPCPS